MRIFGLISFFLAVIGWFVMWCLIFYRRGFKAGHDAGRIAADNWWIEAEEGMGAEREKVWREEIR